MTCADEVSAIVLRLITLITRSPAVTAAWFSVHSVAPLEKSSVKADQQRTHALLTQLAPWAQPPPVQVVGQVVVMPVQRKRPHASPGEEATQRPGCTPLQRSQAAVQALSQQTWSTQVSPLRHVVLD